jgi:hypothetical protein
VGTRLGGIIIVIYKDYDFLFFSFLSFLRYYLVASLSNI